jgi:DNA-binding SARP family transcriptional activator
VLLESGGKMMHDSQELAVLGGFVFSVGGAALLGVSAGSQRLLAFLAVRDRATTRNQIAGTLWPESTDDHAGASLRSAVSRLQGPARAAVTVTAADLSLAEGVAVDVHHSQLLARRLIDRDGARSDGDIGAASVLALSDDLLPGWYDDWAVIAAEDWRQLRINALEAVAGRLTDADRLAEAAAAALAVVRAEPLRESARAALIKVHIAQGNQSAAHGEFERYRVLLRAEIGVEPTSRLRQLLNTLESRV